MLIEYKIDVTGGVVTVAQRIEPDTVAAKATAPNTEATPGSGQQLGGSVHEETAQTSDERGSGPSDKTDTGGGLPGGAGLMIILGPVVLLKGAVKPDDQGGSPSDKPDVEGVR